MIKMRFFRALLMFMGVLILLGCALKEGQGTDDSFRASFSFNPAFSKTNQTVQFTDTSRGNPNSWQWDFGDGATSASRHPNHTFSMASTYTVTLTASNSTDSMSASNVVTVVPPPPPEASFTYTPVFPNPGQTVQFSDTSAENPISWNWDFGDGTVSTVRNPSHAYAEEGTPTVTLTVSNSAGSDTAYRTISVTTMAFLSEDRLVDWGPTGIPGGIPERTTVYRTLGVGATASEINNALAACPPGQVVYLSAGTYNVGQISFGSKTGVSLRGAGPGRTVLMTTAEKAIVNESVVFQEEDGIALAAGGGYTKGSTSITLASAPSGAFAIGNLIQITQDDSPNTFAPGVGVYHRAGFPGVWGMSPTRNLRFTSRIIDINGNTISLASALPWTYTPSLNPKAYPLRGGPGASMCGVENLSLVGGSGKDRAVSFIGADRCWVKNVEARNFVGTTGTIFFEHAFQCEVRRCYVHDALGYPNQNDGYGILLYYGSSCCRVEDNIGYHLANVTLMNGAAGNAILYNFDSAGGRAGLGWITASINCNHGPHGIMNLFEGNVVPRFQNDGYHGSTSHGLLLRNRIHGLHPEGWIQERRLVDLTRGSYFHNIIGNVIGDASWTPNYYELTGSPDHSDNSCIFILGYPNMGNTSLVPAIEWVSYAGALPDARVSSTLIRHGNFDYFHRSVVWDSGIPSHAIPASMVYVLKPEYFGSLRWPPIGPDVSGMASDIPAKSRWDAYLVSGNLDDLFD